MGMGCTEAMGFIYGLVDPRDGTLRYVGQTTKPVEVRHDQHCKDKSGCPKSVWIQELRALGLRPTVNTLGQYPASELDAHEQAAIDVAILAGAQLLNSAAGGGKLVDWNSPAALAIEKHREERARLTADADWQPEGDVPAKLEYWETWPEDGDLPPPTEEEIAAAPEEFRDGLRNYAKEMTDEDVERELAEIAKHEADKQKYTDRQQQRLLQQYRQRTAVA